MSSSIYFSMKAIRSCRRELWPCFVADMPEEVSTLAKAAYPDDDGYFLHYIPREKLARISAN